MDKDEYIKKLEQQNNWFQARISKLENENKSLDELYMRYATGEEYQRREREKLQKEYDKLLAENKRLKEPCLNCNKIKVMAS
ncbi:MAG: hypothetical protein ACI4J7_09880 [Ruminiclostridium sp.]|uniref:hypothetical protein n=1 Tax=Ruminococcus sp. TaxID=41978 RepID=UPI003F1001DA